MKGAGKSKFDLEVIRLVKAKREALMLSQGDIASFLDVARSYIGHIESPHSKAKYNLNHLNILAIEMECSPREFIPMQGIEEKFYKGKGKKA